MNPTARCLLLLLVILSACNKSLPPCSAKWNQWVDETVVTGDGQGHGPDVGSDEWKSVVEFKLGVRGGIAVPDRDTTDWCRFVTQQIKTTQQSAGD